MYNHFEATDGSDVVFSVRGDGQVRFRVKMELENPTRLSIAPRYVALACFVKLLVSTYMWKYPLCAKPGTHRVARPKSDRCNRNFRKPPQTARRMYPNESPLKMPAAISTIDPQRTASVIWIEMELFIEWSNLPVPNRATRKMSSTQRMRNEHTMSYTHNILPPPTPTSSTSDNHWRRRVDTYGGRRNSHFGRPSS